jgi:hypothetical protein
MGRQVRRVPLDFDWPIYQVWQGFLQPDELVPDPCPDCWRSGYAGQRHYGSGVTASHSWVFALMRLLGMLAGDVADQQRHDGVPVTQRITGPGGVERMHPYLQDLQRINVYEHRRPSADIVALTDGLRGERPRVSFGYDDDVAAAALRALVKAAGLPEDWGTCLGCRGRGSVERYPGQYADAEAWEWTEPPPGDGWQLWETVSEGSPISPVFDSAEGLAGWMSSPAYTWGAASPMRYADALTFVRGDGWAPSFVVADGRLTSGEQWVADLGGES